MIVVQKGMTGDPKGVNLMPILFVNFSWHIILVTRIYNSLFERKVFFFNLETHLFPLHRPLRPKNEIHVASKADFAETKDVFRILLQVLKSNLYPVILLTTAY